MQRDYTIKLDLQGAQQTLAALQAIGAALQQMHGPALEVSKALQGIGDQAQQAGPSMLGFTESMLAMRAVTMVVGELKDAFAAVMDQQRQLRDYARETADENLKLRDVLREFKFLKGESGGMGTESEDVLALAHRTGLRPTEAAKFAKAFQDAQSAMGANEKVSPQVAEALQQEGGTLAARADMDPEKMAKIVGIFGRFGAGDDPDKARNVLGMTAKALGVKSMADFKQMMPHFFGLANELAGEGNRIEHVEDLAAYFAAATTVSGGRSQVAQAAQSISQANQMVRKGLADPNSESAQYLKSKGIDENTEPQEAMRLLADDAQRKDADMFLGSKGFHNVTWVRATVRLARAAAAAQEGIKQNSLDRRSGAAGRELHEGNLKFLEQDPAALARIAEADFEAARHAEGKPNEMLEIARRNAATRLSTGPDRTIMPGSKPGEIGDLKYGHSVGGLLDRIGDKVLNPLFGAPSMAQTKVDEDVFNRTIAARRKVGLDGDEGALRRRVFDADPAERGQIFNEMISQVGQRQGGMQALKSEGVLKDDQSLDYLKRMTAALEASARQPFGLPAAAVGFRQ